MSAPRPTAPIEADPADIWAPLDQLVRERLPAFLASLGFIGPALRLRLLPPIADAAATDALRAVARDLRSAIFAQNLEIADRARALLESGADELEYLHARRAIQDPRFERAATMIGIVLDCAAGWAASTALPPGPWPPPRQAAAMVLYQIRTCGL